ncbi:hypothetical protein O7622_05625 [Micromonospora sp. WMMD1076]|uniref:hypothetical protein n=1 Tax=Micromonospora sp. WMMD1076 TaxID=3016103 RepID=UPI00249ABCA9|nr:hypothetical protein [Micromonospora sp. WMMD1076]WFF08052.1 hypothetical protein O7622_05625 [Micromonospora sp. WMMD1076]
MIALVLVALSVRDEVDPAAVDLADVAWELAAPVIVLDTWLTSVLGRTRLAGELADAHLSRRESTTGDYTQGPIGDCTQPVRAAVDRQRLIDAGGLRLGDRILLLPDLNRITDSPPSAVITGRITGTPDRWQPTTTIGWRAPVDTRRMPPDFLVTPDHGQYLCSPCHPRESSVLLLADEHDPRALAQAAHSAAAYLRQCQPTSLLEHDGYRRMLTALTATHRSARIRDILASIHACPEPDIQTAAVAAHDRLLTLIPSSYPVPPVGAMV